MSEYHQLNQSETAWDLAEAYLNRRINEADPDDEYYSREYWEEELEYLSSDDESVYHFADLERQRRFWEEGKRPLTAQQKKNRWIRLAKRINEADIEMGGSGLEGGIKNTVIALNLLLGGYYTVMSCEGHVNPHNSPWVSFSFPGVKFESPTSEIDRQKLEELKSFLDEFYSGRQSPPSVRLHIYDDLEGERSGTHRITPASARDVRFNQGFYFEGSEELLKQEQEELRQFTEFLTQKYFGKDRLNAREHRGPRRRTSAD